MRNLATEWPIATRTQRTKAATRAARIIEIPAHEAEVKHADEAVAEAAAEMIEEKHASPTKNSTMNLASKDMTIITEVRTTLSAYMRKRPAMKRKRHWVLTTREWITEREIPLIELSRSVSSSLTTLMKLCAQQKE